MSTYTDKYGTTGITELQVCMSAAGYYIGRYCDEGPYSRESSYFRSREDAEEALASGYYGRDAEELNNLILIKEG